MLLSRLIFAVAVIWSLFQLWIASPLPYWWNIGVFGSTEARTVHLGFAIFLVYMLYPWRHVASTASAGSASEIPALRRLPLALLAAFCATYPFWFYHPLAARAGAPTVPDVVVAVIGVLLLLEAVRRVLGWALPIVASVFLAYTFAAPYLPEVLARKGASLSRVASHQWLSTEGVFGVPLEVSASFVFLFVLFGTLLQTAGAGQYFIRLAFSLLGHMRGGPAKAAVLASGLTGLMSGSSIANVVTTGTFTIPLMKRVGFPGYKAGAIEVAASTNGQLLPPVMGAAAFLMVEYVGISYAQVIKHAFLPALLSYAALMYVIHLEAVKAGMSGLPRGPMSPLRSRLLAWGLSLSGAVVLFAGIYWLLEALYGWLGHITLWLVVPALLLIYLALLRYSAQQPELDEHDLENLTQVPATAPALKSGLHFLVPVVILVWCLLVLELSPGLSAFYGSVALIVMLLSQRPLLAWFHNQPILPALRQAGGELLRSLHDGARGMLGVALATACAGIVVGTVSLTGIGLVLTELVEILSLGSLLLVLILTALLCMLLGMGLPTTANYIVVATLMAPVVVNLGRAHGLEVPLIAVHLFVFYFGIMADDTPPVGLAAFAASGIARSDPIRTGLQAFTYDIRTALLPFMFIFNTEILLIGVDSIGHLLWVALTSLTAILLFVAAVQGWLLTRSRWWESALLLVAVFSLFRPGFWLDMVYPPFQHYPSTRLAEILGELEPGQMARLSVAVGNGVNPPKERLYTLTVPDVPSAQRLEKLGLTLDQIDSRRVWISDIAFMSPAEQAGLNTANDNHLLGFSAAQAQPNKAWFTLPGWLLLALVWWNQRQRARLAPSTKW